MASKSGGSRPPGQSTDKTAKIASRALQGEKLTKAEVKSLAGSVLRQDATKGPRKR